MTEYYPIFGCTLVFLFLFFNLLWRNPICFVCLPFYFLSLELLIGNLHSFMYVIEFYFHHIFFQFFPFLYSGTLNKLSPLMMHRGYILYNCRNVFAVPHNSNFGSTVQRRFHFNSQSTIKTTLHLFNAALIQLCMHLLNRNSVL
jgi:hypothetical protein